MIYSNSITRSFGNLKIKTSTIRGKTLTQVFDAEGNNILSRLKSFSSKKIGDKYVKTRTIVVRDNIKTLKEVYDRIYDGISNKLLGIRSTFYDTVSNGKLSNPWALPCPIYVLTFAPIVLALFLYNMLPLHKEVLLQLLHLYLCYALLLNIHSFLHNQI